MMGVVAAILMWVAVGVVKASTLLEMGSCPNVTTKADLDLRQLEGRWYHFIRFPNDDEPFATCTQSTYNYTADGYLDVVTKGLDATGEQVTRAGVLAFLPDSPTGALQLDLDGMPPLRLWVVHTDEDKLVCLYSCDEFPGLRAEWAWAITRGLRPMINTVRSCRMKLNQLDVDDSKFKRVRHTTACP